MAYTVHYNLLFWSKSDENKGILPYIVRFMYEGMADSIKIDHKSATGYSHQH